MRKHNDKWKYPLTNVCKCGNNQEAKPCATVKDASGEPIIHFLGLPWRSNKEATAMATKFCDRVNAQSKVGNAAKMREALEETQSVIEKCMEILNRIPDGVEYDGLIDEVAGELCGLRDSHVKPALSAPPRNFDVDTAAHQREIAELRECLNEAIREKCPFTRMSCKHGEPCEYVCGTDKWRKALEGAKDEGK